MQHSKVHIRAEYHGSLPCAIALEQQKRYAIQRITHIVIVSILPTILYSMIKNFNLRLLSRRTAMWMLFAIVFAGLSGNRAYGQLPMTRSVFTAAYTPITTLGGATASTIPLNSDDGTQTLIPIGFTFNYLGTNYTTVDACANGWISFGAAGANAWTNSGLFSATIPNLTLAPWWDDMNTGTIGTILYQTQGVVGSRTFTVQWTDLLSYNGSARTVNFQCILYEGTNVIEFRYGTLGAGAFSTSESASIGIEGATGGAGNFLDAVWLCFHQPILYDHP